MHYQLSKSPKRESIFLKHLLTLSGSGATPEEGEEDKEEEVELRFRTFKPVESDSRFWMMSGSC